VRSVAVHLASRRRARRRPQPGGDLMHGGLCGDAEPMRRPRARRAPAADSAPMRGEFQVGSCLAEASYLGGELDVTRVGACDSDGVELGLAVSIFGGVDVSIGRCWSGQCCFVAVARSDRCRWSSGSGVWPLLLFGIPASVVVGSRGWWSSWLRVWWLSNPSLPWGRRSFGHLAGRSSSPPGGDVM
jgi:hypothetical protein